MKRYLTLQNSPKNAIISENIQSEEFLFYERRNK